MGIVVTCDICGSKADESQNFEIVRFQAWSITMGDNEPIYANSMSEYIVCHDCWQRIEEMKTERKVVE